MLRQRSLQRMAGEWRCLPKAFQASSWHACDADHPRGAKDIRQRTDAATFAESFRIFRRHPASALLVTAPVMGSVATMGSSTWMQALLLRSYHLPMRNVGFVSAASSLLGPLLGGACGTLYRKGPNRATAANSLHFEHLLVPAFLAVALPFKHGAPRDVDTTMARDAVMEHTVHPNDAPYVQNFR